MSADAYGGSVPVIDFTKGEVRYVTPEEARAELDELCRSQGHYFATGGSPPYEDDPCVCGDITFKEWRK